ncbi:hypothetical protein [Streptomyces sp. TLI_185]|uniref:hypothetical protein n=1 Tax=Streptomyces sp. TLI_185 TaxID=2485151 RepID=UPI0037DA512F
MPPIVGMALVPKPAARWASRPRPGHRRWARTDRARPARRVHRGATTPYALYACRLLVISAGAGLSMPALTLGVVTSLPAHQARLGSGPGTSAREIGAALGVAVTGTVLASHPGFTDGMGPALRTVGVLVLAATAVVVAGHRGSAGPSRTAASPAPAKQPVP